MHARWFGIFSIFFIALLLGGAGCISFSSNKSGTTGPAGMFLSSDKGESWQQISLLPKADGIQVLSGVSVFRLAIDPQDPKALYWTSRAEGFYYSYDSGVTWRQPAAPMNAGFIYSIAVNPEDKCTIYATNGAIVYRSDDCSRSWKDVYRESSASDHVSALAFNPFSPHQIFLAKTSGDLLLSYDSGISWNVVHRFGTRLEHLIMDPLQDKVLYLATRQQGMYRSRDGGLTWDTIAEKLKEYPGGLEFRRLYAHPAKKGVLYWISTYGILVSEDSGDTWKPMNLINPPGSVDIYAFAVNPQNDKELYYTATVSERSTFYRSTDGGKNWITKKLPTDQRPTALFVDPKNADRLYIGFTIPPPPQ